MSEAAVPIGPTVERPERPIGTLIALVIGLVGGLLSGLLGIGGGTVMVPLLVLLAGVQQRKAHAISLGAIIPIATVSVVTYAVAGKIDWLAGLALIVGSIFGARTGAGFLERIPERALKVTFGLFLIFAAATLLVSG